VLVNTLAEFGSLTNEATRGIREPFVKFGRMFEQRGKFAASDKWRVTKDQLAEASRGSADRIEQILAEEDLERARRYASSIQRIKTPPIAKPPSISGLSRKKRGKIRANMGWEPPRVQSTPRSVNATACAVQGRRPQCQIQL
jgi:hypothetical protein